MVASLLIPREIDFLGPSRRIWRGDPFIGGYYDVKVEVTMTFGCGLTHIVSAFGHHIQGWVGAYSSEQWPIEEHRDAWLFIVACWGAFWSRRRDSHRTKYTQGVSVTVTQGGYETI